MIDKIFPYFETNHEKLNYKSCDLALTKAHDYIIQCKERYKQYHPEKSYVIQCEAPDDFENPCICQICYKKFTGLFVDVITDISRCGNCMGKNKINLPGAISSVTQQEIQIRSSILDIPESGEYYFKNEMKPHKCPICSGEGKIMSAAKREDSDQYYPTRTDCHACNGKGVIIC